MADVTGALHVQHDGAQYTLRLTFAGIAELQGRFDNTLGGLLDGTAGNAPNFAVFLAIVEVALLKGTPGLDRGRAAALADEMLTKDHELAARVLTAAFPAMAGNGATAGNAKKGRAA
jgi:hypothetical protein